MNTCAPWYPRVDRDAGWRLGDGKSWEERGDIGRLFRQETLPTSYPLGPVGFLMYRIGIRIAMVNDKY